MALADSVQVAAEVEVLVELKVATLLPVVAAYMAEAVPTESAAEEVMRELLELFV
jgi:hypothetical protein